MMDIILLDALVNGEVVLTVEPADTFDQAAREWLDTWNASEDND